MDPEDVEAQEPAVTANGTGGEGDTARPRRADAETLTYLRSLEPLIEQSVKALDAAGRRQQPGHGRRGGQEEEEEEEEGQEAEEAAEDRALLVSNLINELTYKVIDCDSVHSRPLQLCPHAHLSPNTNRHNRIQPPQVASLAMDRHAAPVLEKLARLCTRKQLARLLGGCQGYAYCLASNRYSSHVLQVRACRPHHFLSEAPSIHGSPAD